MLGNLSLGGKPKPAPHHLCPPLLPSFPSPPRNIHTKKAWSPRERDTVWSFVCVLLVVPSTWSRDDHERQCDNLSQVFLGTRLHLTAYPFCSHPNPRRAPFQVALCSSTEFIGHSSAQHCAEKHKVIPVPVLLQALWPWASQVTVFLLHLGETGTLQKKMIRNSGPNEKPRLFIKSLANEPIYVCFS